MCMRHGTALAPLTRGCIRVRLRHELSPVRSLPVSPSGWPFGGHMSTRIRLWSRGRGRRAGPSRRAALAALASTALVLTALVAGWAPTNASAATCGTTNIALHQPTTASSQESSSFPAPNATDGNTGTRWSSQFSDPQWLEVDLGSAQSICQVVLTWETAFGKAFQIQTSNDNSTWTSIFSTTTGTGGTQTLNVSGSGRYIRMFGTVR